MTTHPARHAAADVQRGDVQAGTAGDPGAPRPAVLLWAVLGGALGFFLLQGVGGGTQLVALLPLALAAPMLLPLAPPLARRRLLVAAGADPSLRSG